MARALVARADARHLPLPSGSVDLIVTSPPYWTLRQYEDDGEPLAGQIGAEATPREWLAVMLEATAEWMRVLKPEGSIFINLGDKYATRYSSVRGSGRAGLNNDDDTRGRSGQNHTGTGEKSLLGLPWRYALACVDELDPILRQDCIDDEDGGAYVWAKKNGMPESAADRCRRAHEYVFHLVKQSRYYSAVDVIREAQLGTGGTAPPGRYENRSGNGIKHRSFQPNASANPLGKLPGSVWTFATEPLNLPARLGVEHYAAFPTALPRKCILGWSPTGICTACGQGRRPVAVKTANGRARGDAGDGGRGARGLPGYGDIARSPWQEGVEAVITGYACACTPYTDHPGTGGGGWGSYDSAGRSGGPAPSGTGPWREYHFDRWVPSPTRPAVVVDPFGGVGTTALVAVAHGRHGISFDLSGSYSRAARWRTRDSGERAKARGEDRPPPAKRVRHDLYGGLADELDALLEESS